VQGGNLRTVGEEKYLGGIELVERGMPLKVLDGLMCEAAAVMMEAKFSKTKVKCKFEES
jgi:hypothetical protein